MNKSFLSKLFASAVLGVMSVAAWAANPEAGKVYSVKNVSYGTMLCDNGPANAPGCSAKNDKSLSQRWILEEGDGGFYFRSLGTGLYLRTSGAMSQPWGLVGTKGSTSLMAVNANGGHFNIRAKGNGANLSMHCDGSSNIVCWNADMDPSRWDFVEITMTQAEIDEALAASAALDAIVAQQPVFQAALQKIFSDKACTTLAAAYASKSADQIKEDAEFKKLTAPLQDMVLKVKSGDWTEVANDSLSWDSEHARKFRVQSYEPYSEGNSSWAVVGIQEYTNMNNPSGIISNSSDVLYVMVEGEIKDGATLYMNGATGLGMFNDTHAGYELHEGLNIIPCYSDMAHQFIYYTIATCQDGKMNPEHKLSNYSPLKIHIEGGKVNGFFDYTGDELYKADTNADWLYYMDRAQHPMFDLKAKYTILHFFLPDTPYKPGEEPSAGLRTLFHAGNQRSATVTDGWDMEEAMHIWDQMCFSERLIMGLQSDEDVFSNPLSIVRQPIEADENGNITKYNEVLPYARRADGADDVAPSDLYEYFNNRMMGITMQGNLFMNATSWRTAYNGSTMDGILRSILYDEGGSLWGPAHEYGHCNQTPMKIAGTTEISNNHFSNTAIFYLGRGTSRSDNASYMTETFNAGKTFLEYGIWGTTRMYFQLWLYYHYIGHNRNFYPRLYKFLKDNPINHPYNLNPRYDALQFVKMCCRAAKEDLTPFFEAWGFFVPLKNYHIGDYSNFMANLTQEDIDAVKREIQEEAAAGNWPTNYQIINIDDRPGSLRNDYAPGEASKSKANCGQFGGLEDFRLNAQPSGDISFSIDGFNIHVNHENGTCGTGFIILGENDRLLGFSSYETFPVNSNTVAALVAGTAKIYALGADGTRKEVTNTFLNSDSAARLTQLQALIRLVEPELALVDTTETKVGFYMDFYTKDIEAALANAEKATAADSPETIAELYTALINQYNILMSTDHATVRFIPGATYLIVNEAPANNGSGAPINRAIYYNSRKSGVVSHTTLKNAVKEDNHTAEWRFVVVDEVANKYRIQNVESKKYITFNTEGSDPQATLTDRAADAANFVLREISKGRYALSYSDGEGYLGKFSLHINPNSSSVSTEPVILTGDGWGGSIAWTLTLREASGKYASKTRLEQLVAEATDLMPLGGNIGVEGNIIELTDDSYVCNALYRGDNEADRFTSYSVLHDGDSKTYLHTNYEGTSSTSHYITMDLGEGKAVKSFQVMWNTRALDGSNSPVWAPATVDIRGSVDGSKYALIKTLSGLPSSENTSVTSDLIESETAYRYIRFVVKKVHGSDETNPYFVVSELGVKDARLVNEPVAGVSQEILMNIYTALNDSKGVLNKDNPTQHQLDNAYDVLYPAYVALAEALGVAYRPGQSGIDEITVDGDFNAADGIYDLQGRRYNKVTVPGVYVVNGRKVLVK